MTENRHPSAGSEVPNILQAVEYPRELALIVAVALGALASFLAMWKLVGLPFDVVGLAVTLVGGWPVWKEAAEALHERQVNMEITMAMGVAAALLIGEFATGAVIVAFTLGSMLLEELIKERGRSAIGALLRAAPATALVWRDEGWAEVPAAEVPVGSRVMVRPGAIVPVDGLVKEGRTTVDESAITGEPLPREKLQGSRMFAGTLNGNGAVVLECTGSGAETLFGRIVNLVAESTATRGRTQRLADRVAQSIVYFVLGGALVTFLVTGNLTSTVSVILVAGACGVAAGTPLALLATIANNARRGVIIRGGSAVEALAATDTVVLDKTGTLTFGEPFVERVAVLGGLSEDRVIALAGSIEGSVDHPIARAIRRLPQAGDLGDAKEIEYVPGGGVRGVLETAIIRLGTLAYLEESGVSVPPEARALQARAEEEGKAAVFMSQDGSIEGGFVLRDRVRTEARQAVQELKALGIGVVMLTGDRRAPAERVAEELGIADVRAELTPEGKLGAVRGLKDSGQSVCVVGDGINDAPALAAADIGMAVGSGTEAARESAGAQLVGDDLRGIAAAIRSARRGQGVIMFNFYGTLVVDGAGIVLASIGLLQPLVAAGIHLFSELAFIFNSARLFGGNRRAHHGLAGPAGRAPIDPDTPHPGAG